jgi:hypothetical protein
MCLACEMDALWFAEMEVAAPVPGTAGVPPAPEDSSNAATPNSPERAGGTPAVPGFICEETRSE